MSNDKMSEPTFQQLSDALPVETNWTDELLPEVARHIWNAALSSQAALSQSEPEVSQPVAFQIIETNKNNRLSSTHYLEAVPKTCEVGNVHYTYKINPIFLAPPDYEALKERYECNTAIMHARTKRMNEFFVGNEALKAENKELKEDLQFVEQWANHHAVKSSVSAKEALSCIQHYPSIRAITKSYKDGVIPDTRNPYAENEVLRQRVEDHAQSAESYAEQAKKYSDRCGDLMEERDRLQSELTQEIEDSKAIQKVRDTYSAECVRLQSECDSKQANIDHLMLKYCPDEMTPDQMNEWCIKQRKSDIVIPTSTQEQAK